MIIKCKVCNGTGSYIDAQDVFFNRPKVCKACKGAGEYEMLIPMEDQIKCKMCAAKGVVIDPNSTFMPSPEVCPACNGIGIIERPKIGSLKNRKTMLPTNVSYTSSPKPRPTKYDYDIAISYAREDQTLVDRYCDLLKSKLRIFQDEENKTELWGENMYEMLDDIYRKRALFCVLFISVHYAGKLWTNHERKSAQARAFEENRPYILPVRLDDTELPGLFNTVNYLDIMKHSIEEIAAITIEKVKMFKINRAL